MAVDGVRGSAAPPQFFVDTGGSGSGDAAVVACLSGAPVFIRDQEQFDTLYEAADRLGARPLLTLLENLCGAGGGECSGVAEDGGSEEHIQSAPAPAEQSPSSASPGPCSGADPADSPGPCDSFIPALHITSATHGCGGPGEAGTAAPPSSQNPHPSASAADSETVRRIAPHTLYPDGYMSLLEADALTDLVLETVSDGSEPAARHACHGFMVAACAEFLSPRIKDAVRAARLAPPPQDIGGGGGPSGFGGFGGFGGERRSSGSGDTIPPGHAPAVVCVGADPRDVIGRFLIPWIYGTSVTVDEPEDIVALATMCARFGVRALLGSLRHLLVDAVLRVSADTAAGDPTASTSTSASASASASAASAAAPDARALVEVIEAALAAAAPHVPPMGAPGGVAGDCGGGLLDCSPRSSVSMDADAPSSAPPPPALVNAYSAALTRTCDADPGYGAATVDLVASFAAQLFLPRAPEWTGRSIQPNVMRAIVRSDGLRVTMEKDVLRIVVSYWRSRRARDRAAGNADTAGADAVPLLREVKWEWIPHAVVLRGSEKASRNEWPELPADLLSRGIERRLAMWEASPGAVECEPPRSSVCPVRLCRTSEAKGLFHFLGKVGQKRGAHDPFTAQDDVAAAGPVESMPLCSPWCNPVNAGRVRVTACTPAYGRIANSIERAAGTFFETVEGVKGGWLVIDLGPSISFSPSHYSVAHGRGDTRHILRNWVVEGCVDRAAQEAGEWTLIREHVNCRDIDPNSKGGFCWSCPGRTDRDGRDRSYRYLRLRMTGPNSSGKGVLSVRGLEFYGELVAKRWDATTVCLASPTCGNKWN